MELEIESTLKIAIEAHRSGKLAEAERLYRMITKLQPNHADANHNLGVLGMTLGHHEAALVLFQTALLANPVHMQYRISHINALIALNKNNEAKLSLEEAKNLGLSGDSIDLCEKNIAQLLEIGSQGTEVIEKKDHTNDRSGHLRPRNKFKGKSKGVPSHQEFSKLIEKYNHGDFQAARIAAIQLTDKHPNFPFGWKVLAAAHRALGDFKLAHDAINRCLRLAPEDADAYSNLGNIMLDMGNLQQAENAFRKALKINPKHAEGHNNLGNLLKNLNKLEDAEKAYIEAIKQKPTLADAYSNLGNLLMELARFDEAEVRYRHAIKLRPEFAEVHHNLASLLQELNRFDEAEACAKQAIQIKPSFVDAYVNLGNIYKQMGALEAAEIAYRDAIALSPAFHSAHFNLGGVLYARKEFEEAIYCYRKTIELNKNHFKAYNNLGTALQSLERYFEAETCFREATRLKPDFAEAYSNLGNTLKELLRFEEAESFYKRAIYLIPNSADVYANYANLLENLGYYKEAEENCRRAIELNQRLPEAHANLGNALKRQGRLDEAELAYIEAIRLNPDLAEGYSNLGLTLCLLGKLIQAEDAYEIAIKLKPDFGAAYNNLGLTLQDLGRFSEAESVYRESIRLEPTKMIYRDNLLFAVNYDDSLNAEEVFQEYESYYAAAVQFRPRVFVHSSIQLEGKRRVRIGYSSPDFKGHACRFFMEPLFRFHDKAQFELYAYANVGNPDAHTERLKGYFDHWVDVRQMEDPQMAQRIVDDGIDIMVDLAGHTEGNRLSVFAMKPAPIQISYLGYGYTTGLKEIDYLIGDLHMTPIGCERYFSEGIWRLPGSSFCYEPPRENTPAVGELPAFAKGNVTFGSLSRTIRLNDRLLRVWGEILSRVPKSRLRLDQLPFADAETREFFYNKLEVAGIPRERVDLVSSKPHWDAYHEIDITLDCFPHNAGTTTFESLWMGVPVLSKLDRPSVGRFGACILNAVDLNDWVADSEADYIEKAVAFATDISALASLRGSLRTRLEQSSLMDLQGFVRKVENAFFAMIDERVVNLE